MHFNICRYIFFFSMYVLVARGQETPVTTFRLFVEAGGGYAYKLNNPKSTFGSYTRDGIAGTFRLKWGSSNLLGIGIETGWIPISSTSAKNYNSEFGPIDLSASTSAVPLLGIFSMQRLGIQLHAGFGYYRVHATATVMGEAMESSEWKMGYLLSLGYGKLITPDYRIGMELKWNNIVEHQVSILSVQARIMVMIFGE